MMVRARLLFLSAALTLGLAASSSSWAEMPASMTLAADGTPITQENYPQEWTRRPLVLPRGLLEITAGASQFLSSSSRPSLGVSIAIGLGHQLDFSLGVDLVQRTQVGAGFWYQLMPQLAARAGGYYSFGDLNTRTARVAGFDLGFPIKFVLVKHRLAVRGLDNLVELGNYHWELVQTPLGIQSLDRWRLYFSAPIWLGFTPTSSLLIAAGGSFVNARFLNELADDGLKRVPETLRWLRTFASITVTLKELDIGAGVAHYTYFDAAVPSETSLFISASARPPL